MKIGLAIGCAAAVAAAVVLWLAWGRRYIIEIEQSQLQQSLDKALPVKKTYLKLIAAEVTDAVVTLRENSEEIGFDVGIAVGLPATATLNGRVLLSGKVRYSPEQGAFYVEDPRVRTLKIDRLPDPWAGKTRAATEWAMKELLRERPVYTLRPTDVKQAAAKLLLKDVRVAGGKLRVTLGLGN